MLIGTLAVAALTGTVAAAEATKDESKPAAKANEAPADKVTVISVAGIAQRRSASDPKGKWVPVRNGDVLDELTVVRTGLGSKVTLRLGDRGKITLKSATKVGIGQFRKEGQLLKARLGLKYGSMRSRVERSRGPNDFRIRTAVAILSVRGSGGHSGFWGDSGAHHRSTESTWKMTGGGTDQDIPPGQDGDDKGTRWSDASRRKRSTEKGDPHGGLSPDEKDAVDKDGGIRGGSGFGATGGDIRIFSGLGLHFLIDRRSSYSTE